jgi:uncharacterized protein YlxW (UPF0749 family)
VPAFLFWHEIALPLAITAAGLLAILSAIKAVSRVLERRHELRAAAGSDHGEEVQHLQAEMGQLRAQVEALEERVDFAERMLTQERKRRQLEPGSRES